MTVHFRNGDAKGRRGPSSHQKKKKEKNETFSVLYNIYLPCLYIVSYQIYNVIVVYCNKYKWKIKRYFISTLTTDVFI